MHYLGFGVQEMHCFRDLHEDLTALLFLHVDAELDVIEEIHARKTMRYHLDVVVDVVLEEIRHLDNVGMLVSISS